MAIIGTINSRLDFTRLPVVFLMEEVGVYAPSGAATPKGARFMRRNARGIFSADGAASFLFAQWQACFSFSFAHASGP